MRSRTLAVLLATGLLASACGARLTEEQRAAALAGGGGAVPGQGGPVAGPQVGPTGPAGSANQGTGGAGGAGGPAGGGGGGGGGGTAAACGPPQGSTDTGVTESKMTVANVADISGVQQGLFQSAQDAVKALEAYQNSLGGVCGRELDVMYLDTTQSTGGNRAATLQACDEAFAIVGSMSAFDQGGAQAGEQCGIPEVPAITTNLPKVQASTVFPAYPNRADYFIVAEGNYIKEKFPQAIKKAAILWLANDVTRSNARAREKGLQSVGFEFVYRREVQVVEPNYSPYVFDMQREGVEYVTMVANYQSIARLLEAMQQQSFEPMVTDFDSVVYDPDFIADAGAAAEGTLFFINTAMLEEIGGNQEMQLYASWLKRVAPDAVPDYFGLYAWSAGRLFVKTAEALGPKPTRRGLLDELRKVRAWGGNGLHAEHDVGGKLSSGCLLYGTVQGGKFVRVDPAQGWMCNKGGVIKV